MSEQAAINKTMEKPSGAGDQEARAAALNPVYPPIVKGTGTFDPLALQKFLDGDHADIRNLIKQVVSQFPYYNGTDVAEYRKLVLQWTRQVADTGMGRIFMSRTVGGEDDLPKFMAAFETLAYHDLSLVIKVGVQFGLFAGSIQRLGTNYHHQKYLPDAASGRLLGCFAMTEIGHGSNVQRLETTAIYERERDCFVLHSPTFSAGKNYIGNAGRDGSIAIVFAQLDVNGQKHGVHTFVVPIRDQEGRPLPGVTIQDNGLKMGLNGVDNGAIWFEHVRIPRVEMLNRFADVTEDGQYRTEIQNPAARFFTMIGTLLGGRISIATSANSGAKSALTISIRYGARRRQFGPARSSQETLLLDYPAHQRRLFPLLANVFALDFALKHLVEQSEKIHTEDSRPLETLAAGLKAFTTWNATQVIQTCRETCGGEGYLAVNRLAALKADTDVYTTFEGDNTVLMQLVAKNLLTEFNEKLKGMRPSQITAFMVNHALTTIVRRNPTIVLNTLDAHLRDVKFQLGMLRFRESSMLIRGARAFRHLTLKKKLDPFSAFSRMQRELLDLSRAYIDRVVLQQFAKTVEAVTDQPLRIALKRLCDLFALSQIEMNKGWFLENGALRAVKSRAITRMVDELCLEIRQDAVHYVDAFGIPDSCLAAPIAL
jgi:acyl-CoA oxidase